MARNEAGSSFVELLTAIGIISVLFGILVPAYGHFRSGAHKAICLNHLRQLVLSVRMYGEDFDGRFPTSLYDATFQNYFSRRVEILKCPNDGRNLGDPGLPRGSYGLRDNLSLYKWTNLPQDRPAILGDSSAETLNIGEFSDRHNSLGHIGFVDGHIEAQSRSQATALL